MIASWKLPLRFDPARLQADLGLIAADEWTPHYNTRDYQGDWSGIALRAIGGMAHSLYPDPTGTARFANTPLLDRCAYFREVVAAFECPLEAVRLLRLAPGASVREHRDYKLGLEDGVVRIHVPITSNPDVEFLLEGQRVVMDVGECWYLDVNRPHSVANRGAADRVHLIIDGLVNDWIWSLFPPDQRAAFLGGPHDSDPQPVI